MQENFIPQYNVKSLTDLSTADLAASELAYTNDPEILEPAPSANENPAHERMIVMTDFDTFHAAPDAQSGFKNATNGEEQNYQAGVAAGKAEASAVYEATIKVMETTLGQLKAGFKDQVVHIEESHSRAILKCLETVLPTLADRVLISELQATLLSASGSGLLEKTNISLHPDNRIAKDFLSENGTDSLRLIEDTTQAETAVSVSWDNSRTDIDPIGVAKMCLNLLRGDQHNIGTDVKSGED